MAQNQRAAPLDRPTELAAVVVRVVERIAGVGPFAPEIVGDVGRPKGTIGSKQPRRSVERIRSALGDDVDEHAGRLHRDVGASGRDLHLLDRVEVDGERTSVGDVVPIDAVDEPSPLTVGGAAGKHPDLLAVVRAADVLPIRRDPRRLRQHLEHVAGRRNRLQFLDVEARPLRRAPNVHDRIHAGHDHVFLEAADRELAVDLRAESALQLKPLAHQRLEAGELERDGVGANREPRELVGPCFARDRHARFEQRRTGERHGGAGQHRTGAVGHLSKHLTGVLRRDDVADRDEQHQP